MNIPINSPPRLKNDFKPWRAENLKAENNYRCPDDGNQSFYPFFVESRIEAKPFSSKTDTIPLENIAPNQKDKAFLLFDSALFLTCQLSTVHTERFPIT